MERAEQVRSSEQIVFGWNDMSKYNLRSEEWVDKIEARILDRIRSYQSKNIGFDQEENIK